jgi:hypothetical protein
MLELADRTNGGGVFWRGDSEWKDVRVLLTPSEEQKVVRYARRWWQRGHVPENYDTDLVEQAFVYLNHAYGRKAVQQRLKNLSASVALNCVLTLDLSEPGILRKEDLLWRTLKTIDELEVSPSGKLATITVSAMRGEQIRVLPLQGGPPRVITQSDSGCSEWSKDGRAILFFKRPIEYDNRSKEKNVSTPLWVGTLNRIDIADSDGNLFSKLS